MPHRSVLHPPAESARNGGRWTSNLPCVLGIARTAATVSEGAGYAIACDFARCLRAFHLRKLGQLDAVCSDGYLRANPYATSGEGRARFKRPRGTTRQRGFTRLRGACEAAEWSHQRCKQRSQR